MKIDIVTLCPEVALAPLSDSIIQRARETGVVEVVGHQLRDWSEARELAGAGHLLILCGHYEGVDYRVIESLIDEEISIGDYVLTNGALAAAVVCDAVIRLLPGALGDDTSPQDESFSDPQRLEAPAYTRPITFRGLSVPEVLISGNHRKIQEWKTEQALARTRKTRQDLLE